MDIFGFKKRREKRLAEKKAVANEMKKLNLERIMAEKELYQHRKRTIDNYLEKYRKRQLDNAMAYIEKENEKVRAKNNTCLKCGSTDTIHIMKHISGEIIGANHIYSSSYGLNHHINGSSKLNGEIDTFPVNKCKACGNEWAVEKELKEQDFVVDDYDDFNSVAPGFFARRIHEYFNIEFNPDDITDPCNSIDEKRDELVHRMNTNTILDEYRKAPRYMLEYAAYLGMNDSMWLYNDETVFGTVKGKDKYSYVFPEETWKAVIKLIGWNNYNPSTNEQEELKPEEK